MLGKTERRLALVILFTATIPLAMAIVLASSLFKQASSVWLRPEVHQQLERGADLYKTYVKTVKDDMKHQADALSGDELLRTGARRKDGRQMSQQLEALFPRHPQLVSLAVVEEDGSILAFKDRGKPLDETKERKLEQRRALTLDDGGPQLVATFAFDRRFESELEQAGEVMKAYGNLDKDRDNLYSGYVRAFALLLAMTAIITVVLGFILARGVTRRINRLANAINVVATGDLSVRVPVTGSDELTELSRVFNRMLGEMQQSRARIGYLQRIGAWQEMAQRLAHEIKNPLTPIQLAVQECHRKYDGSDTKYRTLLDTTLEIVEEEVGTLRRLVGNFSSFARLPQAELKEEDLRQFLRECSDQLTHLEDPSLDAPEPEPLGNVDVRWEVPPEPLRAAIDKQMLRRVLVNLVRNAVQALRDAKKTSGHVRVSAEPDEAGIALAIEDDGPGVPEEMRERVFDPYFTTKADGTGLGLAIVKKIVVEHGGSIDVTSSALGGARFVIHLPAPHSLAIAATRPPAPRPSKRLLV